MRLQRIYKSFQAQYYLIRRIGNKKFIFGKITFQYQSAVLFCCNEFEVGRDRDLGWGNGMSKAIM